MTRLMNAIMLDGKKSAAERIVYGAFDKMESRMSRDPLEVYKEALENVKPSLEVRSRRVGGATYQVPVEVRPSRRQTLAIRWIIDTAQETFRKDYGGSSRQRAHGCRAKPRCRLQEAGGYLTGWQKPTARSPIIAGRGQRNPPCRARPR